MKKFSVKLSPAQYALFRDALKKSENVGDCIISHRLSQPCVDFVDSEGVRGTLHSIANVRTATAADIRSYDAVKRKINEGAASAL